MTMRLALVLLAAAVAAQAHVGSPDVFFEGAAGPYRLLVTIRPPEVVPGVAEVEIRSASAEVREIHIVPLRMTGIAANLAPVPDLAQRSKDDPQFYTSALWLMTTGPWKVRVEADGPQGKGTLFVPVPALATRVLGMQKAIGFALAPLALVLCFGLVSIAGAAVREALLETGREPDAGARRRSRIAMGIAAAVVGGALWFGNGWWGAEASAYGNLIYKPLALQPSLEGSRLLLKLTDPGWLDRGTEDLVPDHGHLMHLYVIRLPEMERVWHLHPERTAPATFTQQLPPIPAGRYALYGDVVHAWGMAETATGEIELPAVAGQPLTGDDSGGSAAPLAQADYNRSVIPVSADLRMVWEHDQSPFRARQPYLFRFRLEDNHGQQAGGMELYMGMQGHAAFVAADRSVFAHVHPFGSVAMPALQLAAAADSHAGHGASQAVLPSTVSFPYGFPKAGAYRIFVQMKRAGDVMTGVFDAKVEN